MRPRTRVRGQYVRAPRRLGLDAVEDHGRVHQRSLLLGRGPGAPSLEHPIDDLGELGLVVLGGQHPGRDHGVGDHDGLASDRVAAVLLGLDCGLLGLAGLVLHGGATHGLAEVLQHVRRQRGAELLEARAALVGLVQLGVEAVVLADLAREAGDELGAVGGRADVRTRGAHGRRGAVVVGVIVAGGQGGDGDSGHQR